MIKGSDLAALMDASHAEILSNYPPMTDEMMMDMTGAFMMAPDISHVEECEITRTAWPLGDFGQMTTVPLVLSCSTDAEMEGHSDLIVFVPNWQDMNH